MRPQGTSFAKRPSWVQEATRRKIASPDVAILADGPAQEPRVFDHLLSPTVTFHGHEYQAKVLLLASCTQERYR